MAHVQVLNLGPTLLGFIFSTILVSVLISGVVALWFSPKANSSQETKKVFFITFAVVFLFGLLLT